MILVDVRTSPKTVMMGTHSIFQGTILNRIHIILSGDNIRISQEEKSILKQMISKFIYDTENMLQNQDASIKALETQMGQLAKMIASKELGTFPSNNETIPRNKLRPLNYWVLQFSSQTERPKFFFLKIVS